MPTGGQYDAAIITVLPVELQAVLAGLKADSTKSRLPQDDGSIFYEASIYSDHSDRQLALLITCIGQEGQAMASAHTTRIIENFAPPILILVGIAAGWKEKLRIGDVIVPRTIVDLSLTVLRNEGTEFRPRIPELPYPVQQMMHGFIFDRTAFHGRCQGLFGDPIVPPLGQEENYKKYVTSAPRVADDALASTDSLLKIDTAFPNMQRHHGSGRLHNCLLTSQSSHPVARSPGNFGLWRHV